MSRAYGAHSGLNGVCGHTGARTGSWANQRPGTCGVARRQRFYRSRVVGRVVTEGGACSIRLCYASAAGFTSCTSAIAPSMPLHSLHKQSSKTNPSTPVHPPSRSHPKNGGSNKLSPRVSRPVSTTADARSKFLPSASIAAASRSFCTKRAFRKVPAAARMRRHCRKEVGDCAGHTKHRPKLPVNNRVVSNCIEDRARHTSN